MSTGALARPAGVSRPLQAIRRLPRGWSVLVLSAAAALALAGVAHAYHLAPLPYVGRGALAGLLVFIVCGEALSRLLLPAAWGAVRPLFAVPLGAAVSGLVLTAWGIARVPLHVSLWLTLALGIAASVLVRPRGGGRAPAAGADTMAPLPRGLALSWGLTLLVLLAVATMPAWHLNDDTIYGQNPDAHQVVGIAVLFQHTAPTSTDVALPIDVVPSSWRFRYPIFYPLAAAANLSHFDPIRVFPGMVALLVAIAAFGFGAFAVRCLRAPPAAGPAVSVAVALSVITLHLAWHPYWNQLWCLAMLPYSLLFGWWAAETGAARAWILFALSTVMLALAYPLGLPDPLVVVAALLIVHRRRPRLPNVSGLRGWGALVLGLIVLAPAVAGAALKLGQGLGQFFSPHGALWGGDIHRFLPVGGFVGVGGGILAALAVLLVAALALRQLPGAQAWGLGAAVAVLVLVDLRFRLVRAGAYMDFKQLSFVGPIVLTMAVSAAAALVARRGRMAILGLALGAAWVVPALIQDRREIDTTNVQVSEDMLQIRQWARELPPGASVRVDIPASGTQLWGVYMLGSHPVDALDPVVGTTYAFAPYGTRAQYSLSLRYLPSRVRLIPAPPLLYAVNPPLFENDQFVLRRIAWPASRRGVPVTASQRLVEP